MRGSGGEHRTPPGAASAPPRVHIGSFTSAGGRGITTAAVDPATGALTALSATGGALADPSYLAVDRGSGLLYAVSETQRGAVRAFRPEGDGLAPLGPAVPVGGAGPTHVSLAGRALLTAHYTSGGISSLPLAPDGSPAGPAAVLTHRGGGPDPDRQEGPHAHQVLPDPSGRWVLAVDLGTDSVRVCRLADTAAGALLPHAEVRLRPGSGPRHLAFHPEGGTAYVVHELEPLLTVCGWDRRSGRLEPLGEVPLAAGAARGVRAYPSAVLASPDGRFVRVAVRGADAIATLSLADGPHRPRPASSTPCGGTWPRDLAADPAGRRLYAANERSGDVTWFDVDPATGEPHRAGALAVPAATCVVFA
ncbi:lactonase family protein [Streptomyces globosus]|uniref:lactonase family protein n=1 Tax=Streptomyces TaxID=1883 RepID=UPI000F73C106|nr:lactonase family protein [Streptomyces sp. WAC05292]